MPDAHLDEHRLLTLMGSVVACAAMFLGTAVATAGEVVVRNDSVEDFGFSTIVGGFVTGEEAGSWLTSPCNGSIREIRILWLAGDPGAPPHLGNNIWIRESSAFPSPGGVLQQLEGPLLQVGFLNQFLFVDEAQTIPLDVPVTEGQTFVVTLEFGEATDPQTGSVVRDNDGCQSGKNVLFAPGLGGWVDFCLLLQGDLVFRAVIDCAATTGACCAPGAGCVTVEPSACTAIGGDYQGDNVLCADANCPPAGEACCFMPSGCLDFDPNDCVASGGFPQGPGSTCANTTCFPVGACCAPEGTCSEGSDTDCAASGGTFLGADTTCASATCPQPDGACCLVNGLCFALPEADCMVIPASSWSGAFTDCLDADQNGLADACEPLCGDVVVDADHDCDVDVDDYAVFASCVDTAGPCACFDADGDGDIDLLDFGQFMTRFTGPGAGCP